MKYITFVVPCYNSEKYLDRCLNSLLAVGSDAEIIVVNDGSEDRTGIIAHEYESRYPAIVRVVDKPNGGHGSGVNKGLELASGTYFMVVDSDDWLDPSALDKLMTRLKSFCMIQMRNQNTITPDVIICNYVNDHLNTGKMRVVHYRNVLHPDVISEWKDVRRFTLSQYFVMHSMIYRTRVPRDSGLKLPEHAYYVDNVYAYQPLPEVKYLYYVDCDLYHYFIGRPDQSVSEENLVRRIDQQVLVTRLLLHAADLRKIRMEDARLASYMARYISMLYSMTTVLLHKIGTPEAERTCLDLWNEAKQSDPELYRILRYRSLSAFTMLPGKAGRQIVRFGYYVSRKMYKYN
jgi:glycosyltransferase involved in cell wall biosynthesis